MKFALPFTLIALSGDYSLANPTRRFNPAHPDLPRSAGVPYSRQSQTKLLYSFLLISACQDFATQPANDEIAAIPGFIYNSSEFYGRHRARNSVLKFRWHSPFVLHGSKSRCRFCNFHNPMTLLI